ncbi:MAG: polysaccharide biosynthesis protein [Candidatus Hydrothermia bacterium]
MLINLNPLAIIGRTYPLFREDALRFHKEITEKVKGARFLIIGGAGCVGSGAVKTLVKYNPKSLYILDINENGLTEVIRDVRSSFSYSGEIKTFVIDFCGSEFTNFVNNEGPFDYVLNFSALKHVRSEKDPYTLIRMIKVNVIYVGKALELFKGKINKFFSVSTDKAVNPVNAMGATKRLMELTLLEYSPEINVTSSRFVNVVFSDGSLPYGFIKRLEKNQPLALPENIKRYFITQEEAGILCILSAILGENREIFIPKLEKLNPIEMIDVAEKLLSAVGLKPYYTRDPEEARNILEKAKAEGFWPVLLTPPDTTGEKEIETLKRNNEILDEAKYFDVDVIKLKMQDLKQYSFGEFDKKIMKIASKNSYKRDELLQILREFLPDFKHLDTGKFLDERM